MEQVAQDLGARAALRLQRLAARVASRRPIAAHSLSFELGTLADAETLSKIDRDLETTASIDERIIYQFTAADAAAYDALRSAYNHRPLTDQKTGEALRYSKLIAPARPDALYVGSSRRLRSRIGQHLGRIGGTGTFAMRLALWATEVRAKIELRYWLYAPDTNPIELEALEQELWDARQPLLGKRSGK